MFAVKMNSTKVQNPPRKMQVALLESSVFMSTGNEMWWLFCTHHEALLGDCTIH